MKRTLWGKISLACTLALFMTGCSSLDYVSNDREEVQVKNVTTKEDFILKAVKKTEGYADISVGISETPLDETLVLYIDIKNNSDTSRYKFDVADVLVKSPVGKMSFLQPANYVSEYEMSQAIQYAGYMTAGTALGGFASLQNAYAQNNRNGISTNSDNTGLQSEIEQIQTVARGLQTHAVTSYKFIEPNSSDYFYIFLNTPEEYPITVEYKGLTYQFGGR